MGVEENSESKTAGSFPGIESGNLSEALESLRNAAKDLVRPQVAYQSRTVEGPLETIGLCSNRSVIVVHVPEGPNTPYIHNDGRIYSRVGDSSSPIPANDKATFDLLYQRGADRKSYLAALVGRSPELSKDEEGNSYIHLSILSDPYGTLGHWYEGTYSDFSTAMKGRSIPFDNIYTAPSGFIARQVEANYRPNRLFTWEFSRTCNSFVTIPIPTLPSPESHKSLGSDVMDAWATYSIGAKFASALSSKGLGASRILNLNLLLEILRLVLSRHQTIVGQSGVKGPFYIKARIANVWRAVPFIDLDQYMEHVEMFDLPVVQDSVLVVPEGTSLETFVVSEELVSVPAESENQLPDGSVDMWVEISQALGIPGELLEKNARALASVSRRESEIHRARLPGGTENSPLST